MASTDYIYPGASWDGTISWVGRTPPTESETPLGSGFTQHAIAAFDEPPYMWVTADKEITVCADHGDDSWIDEVEFWCEGNTKTVSTCTLSARTGAIGFSVVLDASEFPIDGDATLYATVRPVNGYELLIGPLYFTANPNGAISRAARYLNYSTGDDAYDGTSPTVDGGGVGPWKTYGYALRYTPSGGVITCAAGTYYDDSDTASYNTVARQIDVVAAAGLVIGDVVFSRHLLASNSLRRLPSKVRFYLITFVWDYVYWYSVSGYHHVFDHCVIKTSYGSVQGAYGIYFPFATNEFRVTGGEKYYLIDSTTDGIEVAGPSMVRGCTVQSMRDTIHLTEGVYPVAIINTESYHTDMCLSRQSVEETLTVDSATYNGGTGRTTIVWSGAPTLKTTAYTLPYVKFITGALAGQHFHFYSQDDDTDTTIVTGDASAAVNGDTAFAVIDYHIDAFQLFAGFDHPGPMVVQRFRTHIDYTKCEYQPMFWNPGTGYYAQNIALQACIFDGHSHVGSTTSSQVYAGMTNVVIRQCTWTDKMLVFRDDSAGWDPASVVIRDSVFHEFSIYADGLPAEFFPARNWFETGTKYGTDQYGLGAVPFDVSYRVVPGSDICGKAAPSFPFDFYGAAKDATLGACNATSSGGTLVMVRR